MIANICSKIVVLFSIWWILIGWALFFCTISLWFFPVGMYIGLSLLILFVIWWIIDAIDQAVPKWQIYTGLLAVILFSLVGAPSISVVWVTYLLKIRDQQTGNL